MDFEEKMIFIQGPLAYDKSKEEKKKLIEHKKTEEVQIYYFIKLNFILVIDK